MRLFIGIPVSASVTEQLAVIRAQLEQPGDGLRWSSPESWHITLQFLGSTTERQFSCVVDHLHKIAAAPFEIRLEGLNFFDRAGVFFAGVPPSPRLAELQRLVTMTTSPCGFKPEERPYHPHITLAREKGRSGGLGKLKPAVDALAKPYAHFTAFTPSEFLLYESISGPTGSRYEVRARFSLNAG